MPNWTNNRLVLNGPAEQISRLRSELESANDDDETVLDFSVHAPEPPLSELPNRDANALAYWRHENWGTRSAGFVHTIKQPKAVKTVVEYRFATAWSAPLGWARTLADAFPELVIQLSFRDEGGPFHVTVEFKNGAETRGFGVQTRLKAELGDLAKALAEAVETLGPDSLDWDLLSQTEWPQAELEDFCAAMEAAAWADESDDDAISKAEIEKGMATLRSCLHQDAALVIDEMRRNEAIEFRVSRLREASYLIGQDDEQVGYALRRLEEADTLTDAGLTGPAGPW